MQDYKWEKNPLDQGEWKEQAPLLLKYVVVFISINLSNPSGLESLKLEHTEQI